MRRVGKPIKNPISGREQGGEGEGQPKGNSCLGQERHPVGPDAEKPGVGQGGLAGIAQDQVQAEGGDGKEAAHDYDLKVVAIR